MSGLSAANKFETCGGEVTLDRPGIRIDRSPPYQSAGFERVDDAGDPAEAQAARTRQCGQAQAVVTCHPQAVQCLERAQRQAMLGLELGVEFAGQLLVSLE